jgi:hypothetical protein
MHTLPQSVQRVIEMVHGVQCVYQQLWVMHAIVGIRVDLCLGAEDAVVMTPTRK